MSEEIEMEADLHTPTPGANIPWAGGQVEFEEEDGKFELEVELTGLQAGGTYRVLLRPPAVVVAEVTVSELGNYDEEKGIEALPLGAKSVAE